MLKVCLGKLNVFLTVSVLFLERTDLDLLVQSNKMTPSALSCADGAQCALLMFVNG